MSLNTLLKYLQVKNIAESLTEEKRIKIAEDVIKGYKIDEDSRSEWLEINKKAVAMMDGSSILNQTEKDFPIPNASKVIYPLIQNAVIQLSSQMIMHVVRNDKVAECTVLGKDHQRVVPNTNFMSPQGGGVQQGGIPQQPQQGPNPQAPQSAPQSNQSPYTLEWVKAAKAKRVSDFLSYELLIESDSWLEDEHKLNHIVAAWGTGFKQVYYDPNTKTNCSELLSPEDVIINNNLYGSLDKCRRYTIRQYLTKNEIIEKSRIGYFLDISFDSIKSNQMDNQDHLNNTEELNPVVETIRQFCYLDLDDDDYEEPYFVHVAVDKKELLAIFPAYEYKNIKVNPKDGEVLAIIPTMDLVDRHLISSCNGKYYSYGLNHLLFHQSASITTILRSLIDAGTLRNAAGTTGFVSKSLKTRERTLRVAMGQFIPVDIPPDGDIDKMIRNLPITEPSQVLLSLLQLLIETGQQSGFISDILTGQTEMQNVPATTMLASIEQGTRAFKPVVQKLFRSLKKEFKLWFNLYSKYLDKDKYFKFQDQDQTITKDDFDDSLDIVPVADPTMSSEAHKYARLNAMMQWAAQLQGSTNIQEATLRYFTDLEFPNPDALVAPPPPPPPPDPKMADVQLKAQTAPLEHQIELLKQQLAFYKVQADHSIKQQDVDIKKKESKAGMAKDLIDTHLDALQAANQAEITKIEAYNADTERQRVAIMDRESRKPSSDKGNSSQN